MRAVMLDVPPHLLAERSRLGLDHHDEMWEGELHMVPPAASEEHQRIGLLLAAALLPVADAAEAQIRYEVAVFDPAVPDEQSYRIPDLTVFGDDVRSPRGVEGAALVVIEIRSPGDESFEKLPFFDRVGVGEVLIIDRDTKDVRRWHRPGGELVEAEPDAQGVHRLSALDVTLHTDEGQLVVTVGAEGVETRI